MKGKSNVVSLSISMRPDLAKKGRALAQREARSLSSLLAWLLMEHLEREELAEEELRGRYGKERGRAF